MPTRGTGRPYLRSVILCERIMEEKDGVLTAVRIIDNVFVAPQRKDVPAPDAMPSVPLNFAVLISFKAGAARGPFEFQTKFLSPSGKATVVEMPPLKANFDQADSGVNFILHLTVVTREEGLYWFEVSIAGESEPVTRVPVKVVYSKRPPS
jgi:hypothetical protein